MNGRFAAEAPATADALSWKVPSLWHSGVRSVAPHRMMGLPGVEKVADRLIGVLLIWRVDGTRAKRRQYRGRRVGSRCRVSDNWHDRNPVYAMGGVYVR